MSDQKTLDRTSPSQDPVGEPRVFAKDSERKTFQKKAGTKNWAQHALEIECTKRSIQLEWQSRRNKRACWIGKVRLQDATGTAFFSVDSGHRRMMSAWNATAKKCLDKIDQITSVMEFLRLPDSKPMSPERLRMEQDTWTQTAQSKAMRGWNRVAARPVVETDEERAASLKRNVRMMEKIASVNVAKARQRGKRQLRLKAMMEVENGDSKEVEDGGNKEDTTMSDVVGDIVSDIVSDLAERLDDWVPLD